MAGELNGTRIHLRMRISGVWVYIGGQTSHTSTANNAVIDITNKDHRSFRTLLPGAGLKSNDISGEFVFNSDLAFSELSSAAETKSVREFDVIMGGMQSSGSYMVASVARTSPDNAAVTATISLVSTEQFTQDVVLAGANPIASFTSTPTNLSVAFADTSTDGDGTVSSWFWSFGDGNSSTTQNPTNVYAAAGTYIVKLTVADDVGNSVEDVQTITITA